MRTTILVLAALAVGLVLGPILLMGENGHAQDGDAGFVGTVRGRTFTHSYKMPMDIGVDRDWKPAERIDEERQLVLVPDLYGELVTVTQHGDAVVMWFRDDEGLVRNSVISDVANKLVNVQFAPARHIGYSYR